MEESNGLAMVRDCKCKCVLVISFFIYIKNQEIFEKVQEMQKILKAW